MSQDGQNARDERLAMYRELHRSVPGLDAMYRLACAVIANHEGTPPRVLIVGAGGGREIEALRKGAVAARITAIDPSVRNLDMARWAAGSDDIDFVLGTAEDLPSGETFDVVTSFLVMHHLPDDGAKLAFLRGLRDRLAPGSRFIHGDAWFDGSASFDRMVPLYRAYADLMGTSAEAVDLELEAIRRLPVASGPRMRALFAEAGLTPPIELLRSLWYRCWISTPRPE